MSRWATTTLCSVRPPPDGHSTHMGRGLLSAGLVLIAAGRLGGSLTGASSTELGWKQWTALLVGTAALGAGCALAGLERDTFVARLAWRRLALGVLGVVGALLLWMLLVALDQSLWHD